MLGGLPFAPKPRPCKACGKNFVPARPMQSVCGPRCATRKVKQDKAEERAQIKTRKEGAKTRGELIDEAQRAFNEFIRLRDAGLPCICCGKPFEPEKLGGSADAGHYLSRSAAPHMRFIENNVFAQRKNCNRPGGTTRAAFRSGVVARIGLEAVEALEADTTSRKWTHDELRAIKAEYAAKVRQLRKERAC